MKRRTIRICASICAFFFLLSSSVPASAATRTAQAAAVQTAAVQTTTRTGISGLSVASLIHTPSASSGSGAQKRGYRGTLLQIPHTASASRRYGAVSIPASYDLRTANKLTPIRDQGDNGDCWAYAAIASLESFLMPGEEDDFSENDLVQNSGFDSSQDPDNGGNDLMATAYLARWSGPLNEGATSGVQKHVQNVDWLPGRVGYGDTDTDNAIKAAVMASGAVSSPIYMDETSYYQASTYSYFDPNNDSANHAVDIVGWNDAYPASNFTTTAGGTPAGNGAFLCRNSWGTGWGNGGYFYVSYYDMTLGQSESAVFDSAASTGNYSRNYQYDPLGLVGEIGMSNSGTQWMANVFTAANSDSLAAVGFYTLIPSTSYKVYIVPDYTGTLANATLAVSGTIADAGYHTVDLPVKAALTSGQPFAVEVEFIGQGGVVPIEGPVSGYSSHATASNGQSFVSDNGTDWEDTTDIDLGDAQDSNSSAAQFVQSGSNSNLNVCLKAFTLPLTISDSTLKANATYYGGIPVEGAASAQAGLTQITVSADGKTLLSLPEANTATADFSYTIPAGTLPSGTHSITVTATDTGNTIVQRTTSIVVGPPVTTIDQVAADSKGDGGWTVAGWSIAPSGIASNTIYIDKGTANEKQYPAAFGPRSDVQQKIYPNGDYPNGPNSGFSVTIPAADLTVGTHTVTVAANANDGSTQLTTRNIVVGPASITTIDGPTDKSALAGVMTVTGWALNHAGINRVDAYLYRGNTPISIGTVWAKDMTDRTDVAGAYAQAGYLGLNAAGYTIQYDTSALPAGNYTLAVAGVGNDGNAQWALKSLTLGALPAHTCIDAPANNAYVTGQNFTISGWALNSSGIQRVDIYAYDHSSTPHKLGSVLAKGMTSRADVAGAFPAYGTLNSGYSLSVSAADLPAGTYNLAVAGIGNDGSVQWASRPITVGPPPQTCIDAPGNGNYVTGQYFTISGWALNHSGIQRVDIYAYDRSSVPHALGSVSSGTLSARIDVAGAFPAYGSLNSGYSLSVSTSGLPAGTYNLAVAGIGNDGDVQWAFRPITVGPPPQTFIDAPAGGSFKAGQSFTVSGWALNHSGIQRVDVYAYDRSNKPHALGSVLVNGMTSRPDVAGKFPAYGMLNSGYSLSVSTSGLPAGTYNLAVAGIGNDGDVQWAFKGFTVT